MESFPTKSARRERQERDLAEGRGDWSYEKVNGRWQQVLLPEPEWFSSEGSKERERRLENFQAMMKETEAEWKLDDPSVEHNEGFLRDHPRYHDLFEKWAIRYLRAKGLVPEKFSGKINPDEGQLYGPDGRLTNKWLVNVVANGREWIDENIEMELRISEGFIPIDEERAAELGIEEENAGWWTSDEI